MDLVNGCIESQNSIGLLIRLQVAIQVYICSPQNVASFSTIFRLSRKHIIVRLLENCSTRSKFENCLRIMIKILDVYKKWADGTEDAAQLSLNFQVENVSPGKHEKTLHVSDTKRIQPIFISFQQNDRLLSDRITLVTDNLEIPSRSNSQYVHFRDANIFNG